MITRLQIQNFRGLREVTFSDLRRINLIVGGNDTGKTSVLEALVLLLGNPSQVISLPFTFRNNQGNGQAAAGGDDRETFWNWLPYDRDAQNLIQIKAEPEEGQSYIFRGDSAPESHASTNGLTAFQRNLAGASLETFVRLGSNHVEVLGMEPPSNLRLSCLSVRPSHPVQDAEKFNQVVVERDGEDRFESLMKKVDARVRRLRYAKLSANSLPLVYVDLGLSRRIPTTQMGDAFNRLFHIYAEILASKARVLLIDEIENGIFSGSLQSIWTGLLEICEAEGVQIFATTHSQECVMAAFAATQTRGKDELCVVRLQRVKDQVEVVRFGIEQLEFAARTGAEVRS